MKYMSILAFMFMLSKNGEISQIIHFYFSFSNISFYFLFVSFVVVISFKDTSQNVILVFLFPVIFILLEHRFIQIGYNLSDENRSNDESKYQNHQNKEHNPQQTHCFICNWIFVKIIEPGFEFLHPTVLSEHDKCGEKTFDKVLKMNIKILFVCE